MARDARTGTRKPGKANLLGRSIDLLRGVSGRLQKEAERAWRLSGLRVEAATLRRKRVEALVRLGEQVQQKLVSGDLPPGELTTLSGRIARLDRKLHLTERTIGRAAIVFARRRAASEDKAPRQSHRLELVREAAGSSHEVAESRAAAASSRLLPGPTLAKPPLPIDPLEDILGAAEEFRIEDIEDDDSAAGGSAGNGPRRGV